MSFHIQLVDYNDAIIQCSNENAKLVSITSQEKQLAILNHLTAIQPISNTNYGFWTSGYRPRLSKRWFWSNSIAFHYTNWAPKQPNGVKLFSYCLYIESSQSRRMLGRWRDGECYLFKYFICEKGKITPYC